MWSASIRLFMFLGVNLTVANIINLIIYIGEVYAGFEAISKIFKGISKNVSEKQTPLK